jgi:hypothetical protein
MILSNDSIVTEQTRLSGRRVGDKLITLTNLCEFLLEQIQCNTHPESAWAEIRDELQNLKLEIESIRVLNDKLLAEIASMKGLIK